MFGIPLDWCLIKNHKGSEYSEYDDDNETDESDAPFLQGGIAPDISGNG